MILFATNYISITEVRAQFVLNTSTEACGGERWCLMIIFS